MLGGFIVGILLIILLIYIVLYLFIYCFDKYGWAKDEWREELLLESLEWALSKGRPKKVTSASEHWAKEASEKWTEDDEKDDE